MKSFKDSMGRTWTLEINVGAVKRIRAICDINILDLVTIDEKTNQPNVDMLTKLSSDPVLLVDCLYAVCKPDADAQGISDEEFGRAMSGDTIEYATNELLDAIVDFFPEAKRKLFQKVLRTAHRFANEQKRVILDMIDKVDLDKVAESQLKKLRDSYTSVLESAE
jgi:hypothetical protein